MADREVDQQLVERAQRGDKRAFELLVLKYQRKLGRLLSRLGRGPRRARARAVRRRRLSKPPARCRAFAEIVRFIRGCTESRSTPPRTTWSRWEDGRQRRPDSTMRRRRILKMPSSFAIRRRRKTSCTASR